MQSNVRSRGFTDPLEVVDHTDMPYEERLGILQEWRARLVSESAPSPDIEEIDGAIQALETGARLQGDQSDEVPEDYDTRRGR
ncbi:hypothetical protein [Amaricoccus solimangrovi]|uniref:Uncharacterized protein n=1 Tax=Amaricoccus solimangrovi TaxID=2589815 RepID=A0A501WWL8_9RHOB|nr:hypothetical protein [Amaricoccus solimangrovi]TPE52534.1 hypothetical protein FJM51_04965 [Amaricoccus solimangrovi]